MQWTLKLHNAALAVATDKTSLPLIDALLSDVRSRAREFATQQPVGRAMTPQQIEYASCLRSRLVYSIPSHAAFETAWGEAWDAALSAFKALS